MIAVLRGGGLGWVLSARVKVECGTKIGRREEGLMRRLERLRMEGWKLIFMIFQQLYDVMSSTEKVGDEGGKKPDVVISRCQAVPVTECGSCDRYKSTTCLPFFHNQKPSTNADSLLLCC